jgi:hypothetical protein
MAAGAARCDDVGTGARQARRGVLVVAGVFSLLSTIAAVGTGGSRHAEPPPSGAADPTKGSAVPSAAVGTD